MENEVAQYKEKEQNFLEEIKEINQRYEEKEQNYNIKIEESKLTIKNLENEVSQYKKMIKKTVIKKKEKKEGKITKKKLNYHYIE